MSPELVLVSPPELAEEARRSLPDFEREWEELVERLRAQDAIAVAAERRRARWAWVFTLAAAVICVAPLVLLILART
jgi:hypothetical protein